MCRTVLGCALDWPLILAPTGMTRLFHKDGEVGVAKVAAQSGAGYTLSTMATASIEEVDRKGGGSGKRGSVSVDLGGWGDVNKKKRMKQCKLDLKIQQKK